MTNTDDENTHAPGGRSWPQLVLRTLIFTREGRQAHIELRQVADDRFEVMTVDESTGAVSEVQPVPPDNALLEFRNRWVAVLRPGQPVALAGFC